jgi:hypothetical protein
MVVVPAPEVLRSYVDEDVEPHFQVLCLRWDLDAPGLAEHLWHLPEGVCLVGPAPERFGLRIHRNAADRYAVRVVWNRSCLSWTSLTRLQLLTSALAPLLSALGTDLWTLLDQPVSAETSLPEKAA